MNGLRRYRPTPSMVVALLALFVALGGGAYAAVSLPKNSVGSKQIKKGAVTSVKLGKNAVTGAKVKDGSLSGSDIDLATLPKVGSATSADHATNADSATNSAHADNATNAGHATNADKATDATNATNATNAGDSAKLGGTPAASFVPAGGTLPSGATESGLWGSGVKTAAASDGWRATAQFPIPLAAALDSAHRIFVSGTSATNCPGVGQADPGFLCVYRTDTINANTPSSGNIYNPESGGGGGAGPHGFGIFLSSTAIGDALVQGVWTVTAP